MKNTTGTIREEDEEDEDNANDEDSSDSGSHSREGPLGSSVLYKYEHCRASKLNTRFKLIYPPGY